MICCERWLKKHHFLNKATDRARIIIGVYFVQAAQTTFSLDKDDSSDDDTSFFQGERGATPIKSKVESSSITKITSPRRSKKEQTQPIIIL